VTSSRAELQARFLLMPEQTKSHHVAAVCCVAVQGGSAAAEWQPGAVHLPGQCSRSQLHLALEEQGLHLIREPS